MAVIVADKHGRTDSVYHTLIKNIESPIPIVLVSWDGDFVFNDALEGVTDYLLICFAEYGWENDLQQTHIWGQNTAQFPRYYTEQWKRFDDWVAANPPRLTFKRELLKKDITDKVVPIDYPCLYASQLEQDKETFDSRPINVFQYWGRSSEHRVRIHAEILAHGYKKGFQVCDNFYYINGYLSNESGEKWVTLWIPHYQRFDISNLFAVNNLSKLSLSWGGAGFKCFRTAEAPVNSIMVMHKNDYAWAYDWDETNCILVDKGKEIEQIEQALQRTDLYDIYINGTQNCRRYLLQNYIANYINPLIAGL